MPCENCLVQFSIIKRKRACLECERYYCGGCLRRGGGTMCPACRLLSTRPLSRQAILHLKVRDLQSFLQRQNVSTRGCVEKEELVSLCVIHVNSPSYRRRGPRFGGSAFSSLKGITTNINDFINSTFDLRGNGTPRPQQTHGGCYNSAHAHPAEFRGSAPRERFSATLNAESEVTVPPPEQPSEPPDVDGALVDTDDCFEIEDLDEGGWEVVTRPAAPLPNDSDVLLAAAEAEAASPRRAASELELRSLQEAEAEVEAEAASLQDVPLMDGEPETPRRVSLSGLRRASELEALSVKQLKELLSRNRVEFRGCVERRELLERARTLWREHAKYKDKDELERLPADEWCKICMDAPLECVLLECGHIAACTACAKQLAECPICRQYVVRAVRFFRS